MQLNDLQQDMLTELFNLGMGNAANALSEMVEEEVLLSIPQVTFMQKSELANLLEVDSGGHISGVSQQFHGMILGEALLTFPTQQSLELVRLLLRNDADLENLTEFEEEALTEVGNIILNAGLSSLADIFEGEITSDLPIFNSGNCTEVIDSSDKSIKTQETVLYLQVDFNIEKKDIKGYVVYLFDVESMAKLSSLIENYISKLTA